MTGEGGDGRGRRARWQLLEVVGQEDQMAGVVGQEVDGREPDGVGAVRQGGPDGQEEGDGRVHEGQMTVAGGSGGDMGQEFKMIGRQGLDHGVRDSYRPDRSSNGQMGVGYCGQDGWGGALGWDTRQGMGWGSRHMIWGVQTGVGFQSCGGISDTGRVPDRDGGVPDRDGGVPDRDGGVPDM